MFIRVIKLNLSRISAMVFGFSILFSLKEIFNYHYLISNIYSIIVVFINNYVTSKEWIWAE